MSALQGVDRMVALIDENYTDTEWYRNGGSESH